MSRLTVIDLSHHNAEPDFKKAKANGLIGVIHKATEGTTYVDEDYDHRQLAAIEAGLCWASYHFLRHGNVQEQMEHYYSTVAPKPGSRMVIDHEHEDVTLDDLREAVEALWDIDDSLQITVYSGHTIKEQLGNSHDKLLATTSLWIAQYSSAAAPSWPTGTWPTWSLWQYSDGTNGGTPKNMTGIPAPHDCNVFNGSDENCVKWFGPVVDEIPEVPNVDPDELVVSISIDVPEGVTVKVRVNDESVG